MFLYLFKQLFLHQIHVLPSIVLSAELTEQRLMSQGVGGLRWRIGPVGAPAPGRAVQRKREWLGFSNDSEFLNP